MRRPIFQALLLGLILAVTLPPLALLCRGRSPSRFEASNLPTWERKPPRALPFKIALRDEPLAPGAILWPEARLRAWRDTDENRLLAGLEFPVPRTAARAGDVGRWLESACALGRQDRRLADKQDRVALRLMNAQDSDGYLGAGSGRTRWSVAQTNAFSQNLRGLLAYYAVSRNPAAIYTAMSAGNLVVATPLLTARKSCLGASLTLPMTRLYLFTGETRYRQWAAHRAHIGQCDGAGWCALYVATGMHGCLQQAQAAWTRAGKLGRKDPDLAGALLAITGAPGYATALRTASAPWPCVLAPGTLACTHTGSRLNIHVLTDCRILWHGVRLTEQSLPRTGATDIIATAVHPTLLAIALPPGTKTLVNGHTQTPVHQQGQIVVIRLWKNGSRLRVLPSVFLKQSLSVRKQ